MSYTDKKNEWWRIDKAEADVHAKAAEIFRMFASKYPTLVVNGRTASFSSKEVNVYLAIKPCIGVNGRVLLRYSTCEDDLRKKSLRSCDTNRTGEVREGHKYSDGSSRIDLDFAFNQVNSFIERKAELLDEVKKVRFKKQLEQMKLVGRIKLCVNDDMFNVVPCSIDIERVKIQNKKNADVVSFKKYDNKYYASFDGIGTMFVKENELDAFIVDSHGFMKYV